MRRDRPRVAAPIGFVDLRPQSIDALICRWGRQAVLRYHSRSATTLVRLHGCLAVRPPCLQRAFKCGPRVVRTAEHVARESGDLLDRPGTAGCTTRISNGYHRRHQLGTPSRLFGTGPPASRSRPCSSPKSWREHPGDLVHDHAPASDDGPNRWASSSASIVRRPTIPLVTDHLLQVLEHWEVDRRGASHRSRCLLPSRIDNSQQRVAPEGLADVIVHTRRARTRRPAAEGRWP